MTTLTTMQYKEVYAKEYYNKNRQTGAFKVICSGGDVRWYFNKVFHRTNGPAVIHASGYQAYYQNGDLHRVDGPAITRSSGEKTWAINGITYLKEEWFSKLTKEQLTIALANPENF